MSPCPVRIERPIWRVEPVVNQKTDEVRVSVAGRLNSQLTFDGGRWSCGQIRDGVSFRLADEEGSWVMAYEDLKKIFVLATAIRERKAKQNSAHKPRSKKRKPRYRFVEDQCT